MWPRPAPGRRDGVIGVGPGARVIDADRVARRQPRRRGDAVPDGLDVGAVDAAGEQVGRGRLQRGAVGEDRFQRRLQALHRVGRRRRRFAQGRRRCGAGGASGRGVPGELFARQQAVEVVEQRLARRARSGTGRTPAAAPRFGRARRPEARRGRRGCRRTAGRRPGVVVGEAGADEVAVEQHAPGLAVQQGERETAVEAVHGQVAVFEVVAAQLLGDGLEVERARLARRRA